MSIQKILAYKFGRRLFEIREEAVEAKLADFIVEKSSPKGQLTPALVARCVRENLAEIVEIVDERPGEAS